MTLPVANTPVYTDLKGLESLKRGAKAQDPQAIREAARQFESLFARMMLKSMRDANATFKDPLTSSDSEDFYQGMFDDQMALQMSRGKGLGLADMLVQQLTRAGLTPPAPTDSTDPAAAPIKPQSLLNPMAAPNSTTPAKALALVEQLATTTDISQTTTEAQTTADTVGASAAWPPATPQDFVRQLWPLAQQAGKQLGVDPRHILAQAALETGWGRAVPSDTEGRSSFNFFGIKAGTQWGGSAVSVRTLEFENGIPTPRRDRFRAYDSPEAAFGDYVAVLKNNPRYAAALNTGGDAHAFANGLQIGGYATDPAYARKIAAIAQNLDRAPPALKSADARPLSRQLIPF